VALHFLHVGKTGGSALKYALRDAGWPDTPFGPLVEHPHRRRWNELPPDEPVFFFVRDPIDRFLSGFTARQRRGAPRYHFRWTEAESEAFSRFSSAQELATSLESPDPDTARAAHRAMRRIRHLRSQSWTVGGPADLRPRLDRVVYIGRQETLDADWQNLQRILEVPDYIELPRDPVTANRTGDWSRDQIDDRARAALRRYYDKDYRLLDLCDDVRRRRGWVPARGLLGRLRANLR
jgi:hypothetical protein